MDISEEKVEKTLYQKLRLTYHTLMLSTVVLLSSFVYYHYHDYVEMKDSLSKMEKSKDNYAKMLAASLNGEPLFDKRNGLSIFPGRAVTVKIDVIRQKGLK